MSDDQDEIEEAEEVDAEPTPSAIVEEEELDEIVEVLEEEEEELDDDYASDESDETALIGFGFRIEGDSEEGTEEDEGY